MELNVLRMLAEVAKDFFLTVGLLTIKK